VLWTARPEHPAQLRAAGDADLRAVKLAAGRATDGPEPRLGEKPSCGFAFSPSLDRFGGHVSNGVVQEVGLANKLFSATRAAQKFLLASWGALPWGHEPP
jgi:hypothetical protein